MKELNEEELSKIVGGSSEESEIFDPYVNFYISNGFGKHKKHGKHNTFTIYKRL